MESLHVGIDLGTVNSCMAMCINGKSEIITCRDGEITPSFVEFDPNIQTAHVGKFALNDTQNYKNVIYDAKRFIGKPFNHCSVQNIYNNYPFKIKSGEEGAIVFEVDQNGTTINKSPVDVSAEILSYFKQCLDMKYPHVENVQVVISIPAYFTAPQRAATLEAVTKAGFTFCHLVSEPAAAALNFYRMEEDLEGWTLVFDLGGGTFDIAIVAGDTRFVMMKCYDGDNFLGGRNFEEEMFKYFIASYREKGINLNSEQISRLQKCLKRIKEMLSKRENAKVDLEDFLQEGLDEEISLTRSKFEEINSKLFQKCIDIIERCLSQNEIKKSNIKNVVMVGGSTRIPKIQELVKSFLGESCKYYSVDPDLSVALGAAYHAVKFDDEINAAIMPEEEYMKLKLLDVVPMDMSVALGAACRAVKFDDEINASIMLEEEYKKLKLLDVVPMDIGIRTHFGLFIPIIKRNSSLPIKATKRLHFHGGHKHTQTNIYEGNWYCAAQNNFLVKIMHENLPLYKKINHDITFEIDENYILKVTSKLLEMNEVKNLSIRLNENRKPTPSEDWTVEKDELFRELAIKKQTFWKEYRDSGCKIDETLYGQLYDINTLDELNEVLEREYKKIKK